MTDQEDLQKWFEGAVNKAEGISKELQQEYLQPAIKRSHKYAQQRPVLSVFVVAFVTLSIIPFGVFLCASFFVLGVSVLVAATFVSLCLLAFLCIAGPVLLLFLLGTLLLSLYLSLLVISGYLLVRLVKDTRASGGWKSGFELWVEECKVTLLNVRPAVDYQHPTPALEHKNEELVIPTIKFDETR